MDKRAALFLIGFCLPSSGSTYYVDNTAANTSDNNTGTAVAPFKTIQKAATTVVAGDSVIVRSGTYSERITFGTGHSGAAGKRITFVAQPRRTVYMQGFNTAGANHLRVDGFDIAYSQGGWLGGGVWISSDTVEIVDNYLHDIPGPGIQMNWSGGPWDSIYIADNHVYRCQYGITVTGTNILVENNEVERLYQFDTTGDCDYSRFFGDNIVFRGNKFHNTIFSEVGSAHLDCWQTFDNNGEHAVNITWDGNWCGECDEGLMAEATFHHNSHDFVFKNNVFAHSAAWGLCVKDIANVKVYNNVFYDIQYHGAGFSGAYATGADVKNNIFDKSETSYWASDSGKVTGDHNLLFKSDTTGAAHNKIGANPLFADTAAGDFHLLPGSPAIDAGTVVPGVTADFDGNVRPYNGAYDIGAFEYGSSNQGVIFPKVKTPRKSSGLFHETSTIMYDLNGRGVAPGRIKAGGVFFMQDLRTGTVVKRILVK